MYNTSVFTEQSLNNTLPSICTFLVVKFFYLKVYSESHLKTFDT